MFKTLYLRNFRNFKETEILFAPKLNVIYGENGQGKTNLLEAIVLLSVGRSFRTQHLSELIREGEKGFYIEGEFSLGGISHRIKLSFDGKVKQLQIDSNRYSHFNPLLGLFPSVLYAPQGSEIISGAPLFRRRFFDLHLAQSNPLYVHHLARFYRAMKQRNALLRAHSHDTISCWETEMAKAASFLQQARQKLAHSLQPLLTEQSLFLSQTQETHTLAFHPSYPADPHLYLALLQKNRPRDEERQQTSHGPHRDELSFSINGKPSRLFASEGQKKTTLASLKLAEWRHLAAHTDSSPLFAIDDFGQPLDHKREELFCQTLTTLGQVFITTPKELSFSSSTHGIEIRQGCLKSGLAQISCADFK